MKEIIHKKIELEEYDIAAAGMEHYEKIYVLSKSGEICNSIETKDILKDAHAVNMFYMPRSGLGRCDLKLYFDSGDIARIKIPSCEFYLDDKEAVYNLGKIQQDISVNEKTLFINGIPLYFKWNIRDIQLYKNYIIVLLNYYQENGKTYDTAKDHCNVFCVDMSGKIIWQIENFFEKFGITYNDIILSYNDIIISIIVDEDLIYGRTYHGREITINGNNGSVINMTGAVRFC